MHQPSHTPLTVSTPPAIEAWLRQQFGHTAFQLEPISGDASFRSYHRVRLANTSYALLHSPKSDPLHPFVSMSHLLHNIGLSVPMVFALDHGLGVALLSDLGNQHYFETLDSHTAPDLYRSAMQAICWMQQHMHPKQTPLTLPYFSIDLMKQQLQLFKHWYLEKHLGHALSHGAEQALDALLHHLVTSIQEQPYAFAHMDYHSRNLMVLPTAEHNPGILDFQDAMWAPMTLDLVSLLKDCYLDWPRTQVCDWVAEFYHLQPASAQASYGLTQLLQWFDWTGLQRHLRILGTFARLHHLHGKSAYLQYLPRILGYIQTVCECYPSLQALPSYLPKEFSPCVP